MSKETQELKYGQLPPEPEQQEFVKQAVQRINAYGFAMKRSFDEKKVDDALEYAGKMLEDMKTNKITPIHYNDLYQLVMSELSTLAANFQDEEFFSARRIAELYEELQYTSSIVPRLYLLITVSPAFIKHGHATVRDVMRDLIEMVRGVQHPTRALFLRHFLLHVMKGVLPNGGDEESTDLVDTLNFLLENFKQMNVLWVRLEFSLDTKTVEERTLQRKQLKQLVGSNIQRIGGLDLTVTHYKELVLPSILEQVRECREALAQNYILECVIQVFPADFHVETLNELFEILGQLEDDVPTLKLVAGIVDRLQRYYSDEVSDKESAIATVRLIAQRIDSLVEGGQRMFTLEDTLETLGTLLKFTLNADPGNTANVDSILRFVENHIQGMYGEKRLESVTVSLKLRHFLITPLDAMGDASVLFDLTFFPVLTSRMMYNDRKRIALKVCESFARTEAVIDDNEKLRAFFNIIQVLMLRPADFEADPDGISIGEHLLSVARVFHLIENKDSYDETFALLCTVAQTIQSLETEVKASLYMPLGQSLLRLALLVAGEQESTGTTTVRKVLQNIYLLLKEGEDVPIQCFWLYLEAAKVSDRCGTAPITTEFFVSALKLWKEVTVDNEEKFKMLTVMIKTATEMKRLDAGQYSSVTNELCNDASGLLEKHQQVEAYLLCSHLFNITRDETVEGDEEEDEDVDAFKSPDRIKNCLVRALKAISQMMEPLDQLPYYYRVLSHAIYYLESGVELSIDWFKALTGKIDKDHEEMAQQIQAKLSKADAQFYRNLIRHKDAVIHIE